MKTNFKHKCWYAVILALLVTSHAWGADATVTLTYEGSGIFPYNSDWESDGSASTSYNHTTSGSASAMFATTSDSYIKYKNSLNNVKSVTFWHYRNSTNSTNPTITLQTSSDGITWSDAKSVTPEMARRTWESSTLTLDAAFTGYVRLKYSCTSNAQKFIDDVTITYEGSSYTITATSNNNSYGTVSVSGTTITATPTSGYRVKSGTEGYTVTTGTATVTNNGDNTFTVSASSDCTIQINFETIPSHNIIFNTNGGSSISSQSVREGSTYTLSNAGTPTLSSCTYSTFYGWSETNNITETASAPTVITEYEMSTADKNLYAVYSRTNGGGGAAVGTTMFSENWTDVTASTQPTSPTTNGSSVYGSASVSYSWHTPSGGSTTQTYTSGGPNSNANILVSKNSGYWQVSGIPTGGATTLTLSYATSGSGTLSVSTSTENVSISGSTITISKPDDVSSFDLKFTNTNTSNNLRLDDITVVVATTSNAGTTYYSTNPVCCENLGQINGPIMLPHAY